MSETKSPVPRIGSKTPRIAVVQAEGPEGFRALRLGVGAAAFDRRGERFIALAVRLDLDLRGPEGSVSSVARPRAPSAMWADRPADPVDPSGSILSYASDFAPKKPEADVLLVGHARASGTVESIEGSVTIASATGGGSFTGLFTARAGQSTTAIPLRAPYLYVGGTLGRVAPAANTERFVAGQLEDTTDSTFQAAGPGWRAPLGVLGPRSTVRTRGLFGVEEVELSLPDLEPVATADIGATRDLAVPLVLDTLWIDTDEAVGALVWRALVPLADNDVVERVVLSLERPGAHRDAQTRLADTQRGHVHYAFTEEDAHAKRPPPATDPVLEYHKHMTWGETAPEPRIELETYATVSAALAETPKERDKVLERYGFDEEKWMIEERAWLELFAVDAMEQKGELGAHYGELFLRAQDALATPEEERLTLLDYAGLRADMQRAIDPSVVLDRAKISLAQYMRLERRWLAKAEADPGLAEELERLLEEFGAEADPLDNLAFDDEPEEDD